MTELARTLRDLYDSEGGGTAFALDGLVEADVLEKWLRLGVLGQTSNQTLFLAKVTAGLLDAEIAACPRWTPLIHPKTAVPTRIVFIAQSSRF